jgi:hypothetical protein
MEAVIVDAVGSFTVNGNVERPGASDILNAIKTIMNRSIDQGVTPQMILARLITVDGLGSGLDAALLGGKPPEYYQAASSAGYFIKLISGLETLIPWLELSIDYAPEKKYAVFITANGLHKDFISFPYETKDEGLRVIPQRLLNGRLVPGTEKKKWGTGKWGEGGQWVEGRKWGEGMWGSGTWDASRFVGGEAWGEYDSMPINIEIKEV